MRKFIYCAVIAAAMLANVNAAAPVIKPIEKTSFDKVTRNLDPQGTTFNYYSAKSGNESFRKIYNIISKRITAQGKNGPTAVAVMKIIENLSKASGYGLIDGYGLSSIKISEKLYRIRDFIGYSENPQGFLWKMVIDKNDNKLINGLSKDTLIAFSAYYNTSPLWNAVRKEIMASKLPDAVKAIKEFEQSSRQNGFDIDKMLASLNGRFIYALTCTPGKKTSIFTPAGPIATDELNIMLALKVNNDFIFKALKAKIAPSVPNKSTDKQQTAANIINIPMPPLVPNWKPVIRLENDMMFLASNNSVIDDFLANMTNGKGLASDAGFKQLADRLPTDYSAFAYISPRTDKVIKNIVLQLAKDNIEPINLIMEFFDIPQLLSVVEYCPDGILTTSNTDFDLSNLYSMQQSMVPQVAIMAGMLLPALNTARGKAREVSCASNMKQIGLACIMYSTDHKDKLPANFDILKKENYLTDEQIYLCPESKQPYIYWGGAVSDLNTVKEPSNTIILTEAPSNHKEKINALFVDGHVQGFRIKANNIEELKQQFKKLGFIVPEPQQAAAPEKQK